MRIEIEIPEEFEADYNINRFSDFFSRVKADIDYNGICGNYERETADVLAEAFKNSKVVHTVDYRGGRLIDADRLIEKFKNKNIQITFDLPVEEILGQDVDLDDFSMLMQDAIQAYKKMVIDTIKNQSTAYDVDKVVEQLEEHTAFLKDCTKYGNKTTDQQSKSYDTMMMYEVKDLVDDLLEIVKAGGTDGN